MSCVAPAATFVLSVGPPARHQPLLVWALAFSKPVFTLTNAFPTPHIHSITCKGHLMKPPQEIHEVVKDKTVWRTSAPVVPVLDDHRPTLFQCLLDGLKFFRRGDFAPLDIPVVSLVPKTRLHSNSTRQQPRSRTPEQCIRFRRPTGVTVNLGLVPPRTTKFSSGAGVTSYLGKP